MPAVQTYVTPIARAVDLGSFKLESEYQPKGDQPKAIDELAEGLTRGDPAQTLLGVTGSGKTFTIANVIERVDRPTLVISHNKTLAAQLYGEFSGYFPENAVEYFVSYYDYYQPEAYKPSTDTYIEKEIDLNEEIERLRLKAMSALLERRDVLIVATISCIYGLGSPKEFAEQKLHLNVGQKVERDAILRKLIKVYYSRNDLELQRGYFRVRGDIVEIVPASDDQAIRIELFGDEVESLSLIDRLIENTVLCGLVTACRLAVWPTRRSPSFEKPTTEGVVRPPSEFVITSDSLPSITATQEFVVPRSMPITFAIGNLPDRYRSTC